MKTTKEKAPPKGISSFFDIVDILLKKKPIPSDEDIQKHCNQYMVVTYLSCEAQFAEIAHEMAKLKITNKMFFMCLYEGLPKCNKFIKWNASKTKKEQHIVHLMEYFGCSQITAKQYLQLISKEELEKINDIYENQGIKK